MRFRRHGGREGARFRCDAAGQGRGRDHGADALLTAAWLRANAGQEELWHASGLTPEITRTEGWTFGAA